MQSSMDNALAACLVAARRLSHISEFSTEVPPLFSLDARLKMPKGYAYQYTAGKLGFRNISSAGAPLGSLHFPKVSNQPNSSR